MANIPVDGVIVEDSEAAACVRATCRVDFIVKALVLEFWLEDKSARGIDHDFSQLG